VQAAVDGQDVLGVQPARLAVLPPAHGELVVDALHLQRLQPGQELVADEGAHVVGQQAAVAGDRAGAADGADVGQPAVQVLVDGEPVRLQAETVAAASAWLRVG
jgi:sarcosine oxidase gamma subunit